MAVVTGLTATRMLAIEAASVIGGIVNQAGRLILTKKDGTTIDAGYVIGPQGATGPTGTIQNAAAGGDLQGNYPNPTIKNKDAAADVASMRTLGPSGTQAAAGNHSHGGLADSGWVNFEPVAGQGVFSAQPATVCRYRKIGKQVHLQVIKPNATLADYTASSNGDYGNIFVIGNNSVPETARPDTNNVQGSTRWGDVSPTAVLSITGGVVLVGGPIRAYSAGTTFYADFFYMTDN